MVLDMKVSETETGVVVEFDHDGERYQRGVRAADTTVERVQMLVLAGVRTAIGQLGLEVDEVRLTVAIPELAGCIEAPSPEHLADIRGAYATMATPDGEAPQS